MNKKIENLKEKKSWKNWPNLLKGGMIGGLIGSGAAVIRLFLSYVYAVWKCIGVSSEGGHSCIFGPLPLDFILLGFSLTILFYFLIGASIGILFAFVVGKTKSKFK